MSLILAGDLVTRCSIALLDTNNANWSAAELLGYLNEAQRAIAVAQPTATSVIVSVGLQAGARQKLPADGWLLFDVLRNMGQAPGNTPGSAIRIIARRLLDTYAPSWMYGAQSSVVQSYIYDLRDQESYFVYPPNDGTGFVEINYSQVPPPVTAAQTVEVTDALDMALYNFMMYRAWSKKKEAALAEGYKAIFNAALGMKTASEQGSNPNAALLPAVVNKETGET